MNKSWQNILETGQHFLEIDHSMFGIEMGRNLRKCIKMMICVTEGKNNF